MSRESLATQVPASVASMLDAVAYVSGDKIWMESLDVVDGEKKEQTGIFLGATSFGHAVVLWEGLDKPQFAPFSCLHRRGPNA